MKFNIYPFPKQPGAAPLGVIDFSKGYPDAHSLPEPLNHEVEHFLDRTPTVFMPESTRLEPVDYSREGHQLALMAKLNQLDLQAEPVT